MTTTAEPNTMRHYLTSVVSAYRSFLESEEVTFIDREVDEWAVCWFDGDLTRTFTFVINGGGVDATIESDAGKAVYRYFPHGVTQPTLHHIREHLNQMSECEAADQKCIKHSRSEILACRDHVVRRYQDVGGIVSDGWSHGITGDSDFVLFERYSRSVLKVEADYVTGFVRATIGTETWPWSPGEVLEDHSIRRHIELGNKSIRLAREDAEQKAITNVPSWFESDAPGESDHTGHVFGGPTITGDPSALAGVLGKMGRRAARETHAIREVDAEAMRKTLVGLGLQSTTQTVMDAVDALGYHSSASAGAVTADMAKAVAEWDPAKDEASREYRRKVVEIVTRPGPRLFVDLSDEYDARPIDARPMDRVETVAEWTARKTAELEARFSATIRNTLREWPAHQGVPMIIHTHVDQGVFVLTLKAAP